MALIQSNPDAEPELVEQTGDYLNSATGHRAFFVQGDPLTPGYVPDDAPEITEDADDARLRRAVAAETRQLERDKEAAEKAAAVAEEQRKEAQSLVEQLEAEKAEQERDKDERIAELEAQLAAATSGNDSDGQGDGGAGSGTPRARRKAAGG